MKVSPGMLVFVGIGAGLVGWMGIRVKDAMHTKEALAAERASQAKEAQASVGAPAKVKVIRPAATSWTPRVTFEGTLNPAREADLGFKVPGRLSRVSVKVGQRVSEGQVIASLEASDAEAQVRAAEAQLRAIEAQLAIAADGAKRTAQLLATGSASQAMGLQTDQQRALVEAQRDAARAQVELAKASHRNHGLTAPFSGIITKVPSGTGAIVGPGSVLFHLEETQTLKLSGTIGEADVALVKVGDPVEVRAGETTLSGKLVAVLPSVDAATRRVPVEVELKNDPKTPLLARSFVRASVQSGRAIAGLKLPHEALRPGSQSEVMVAKDGVLEPRTIALTIAENGDLLVRSGVAATDEVVVSPSAESKSGDKVAIETAAAAAPKASSNTAVAEKNK